MDRQARAVASMATASVFFFFMSSGVKWIPRIPTVEIVFFRALIALVLCLVQLRLLGVSPRGTHRRLLLLRGIFGTGALFLYFWTLHALPLATASVLQNVAPLFATGLAVPLLGERVAPVQGLFFAAALGGVAAINPPGGGDALAIGAGLLSAALSASAYSCIRLIGDREHPLVIILWFPLVTVPAMLPFLPAVWVWPTAEEWVALGLVGVFVQTAQYFMTRAYQLGEVGLVSIVSYLGVVWAALGGLFVFDEPIALRLVAGGGIVLFAVIGNTLVKRAHPSR